MSMHRPANTRRFYVGNLPYAMTTKDLKAVAEGLCTTVLYVRVITDMHTDKSRGFGFIEVESEKDAEIIRNEMHGLIVDGRDLRIRDAHPKLAVKDDAPAASSQN